MTAPLPPCPLEQSALPRTESGRRICSIWNLTPCGVDDPSTCKVLKEFEAMRIAKDANKVAQPPKAVRRRARK
jgi:hypothetical protein